MIFDMALERRALRRNFWDFLGGRHGVSDGARAQKFDRAHGTTPKTSINISWCRFQWRKWPKLTKIMDFWCSVARGVWFGGGSMCWEIFFWPAPQNRPICFDLKISEISDTCAPPNEPLKISKFHEFSLKNTKNCLKFRFLVPCAGWWLRSELGRCRTSSELFTRFEH